MGFASSKSGGIYNRRKWKGQLEERRDDGCGHVWEWDPADRMMRCYKCGGVRLPTDVDKIVTRTENGDTDF